MEAGSGCGGPGWESPSVTAKQTSSGSHHSGCAAPMGAIARPGDQLSQPQGKPCRLLEALQRVEGRGEVGELNSLRQGVGCRNPR